MRVLSPSCVAVLITVTVFYAQSQTAPSYKECRICKNKQMDIVMVLDGSNSLSLSDFRNARWFVENFVDNFDVGSNAVRIGLLTYGGSVNTRDAIQLSAFKEKEGLKRACRRLQQPLGQTTETGQAISHMRRHMMDKARPGVAKVGIVITDGNSQRTDYTHEEAVRAWQQDGITMLSVGVGRNVGLQELRNIASHEDNVFEVPSYNLMNTIKTSLAYRTCEEQADPERVCHDNPFDMAFVIDSSASVGQDNFTAGQNFLREFVENFNVGPNSVRIAAVPFARDVYESDAFDFDSTRNEIEAADAIQRIPYHAGDYTNTGLGLKYVRTKQMPKARSNAAHVCIVLTDGKSQNRKLTSREASAVRRAGVKTFAVGVGEFGKQLSLKELEDIAGSKDRVFQVPSYEALNEILSKLERQTCFVVFEQYKHRREAQMLLDGYQWKAREKTQST